MRKKLLSLLCMILGFGLILYPFLGNLFHDQETKNQISVFEKEVEKLNSKEKQQLQTKIEQYNHNADMSFLKDPYLDQTENKVDSSIEIKGMIGEIMIPKIHLDELIYEGCSEEVLQKGVGHVLHTSLPTSQNGTHSVLAGHRGLAQAEMFSSLNEMEIGDFFYVKTLEGTFQYEIISIETVLPDEIESLQIQKGVDLVTLVTCTPYMINTHRLLVTGKRISDSETIKPMQEHSLSWYILVFLVGIILIIIIFKIIKLVKCRNKKIKE